MSDINNMNVANAGFPEDDGLNIEEIFGGGDNADADLPPVGDADIFAGTEPESADAVPATDSRTVSVSEEPENASAVPSNEASESSASGDKDAVPAQESANASAPTEPPKNGEKIPKRRGNLTAKRPPRRKPDSRKTRTNRASLRKRSRICSPLLPTATRTRPCSRRKRKLPPPTASLSPSLTSARVLLWRSERGDCGRQPDV